MVPSRKVRGGMVNRTSGRGFRVRRVEIGQYTPNRLRELQARGFAFMCAVTTASHDGATLSACHAVFPCP